MWLNIILLSSPIYIPLNFFKLSQYLSGLYTNMVQIHTEQYCTKEEVYNWNKWFLGPDFCTKTEMVTWPAATGHMTTYTKNNTVQRRKFTTEISDSWGLISVQKLRWSHDLQLLVTWPGWQSSSGGNPLVEQYVGLFADEDRLWSWVVLAVSWDTGGGRTGGGGGGRRERLCIKGNDCCIARGYWSNKLRTNMDLTSCHCI